MSEEFLDRCRAALDTVREIEEADGRPPTAEEIAEVRGWSIEYTHFLLHRMTDHGVLAKIPSSFDDRYAVEDEDLLADIPKPEDEPSVNEADRERRRRVDEQVQDIHKRFATGYVDENKSKLFDDLRDRLAGRGETRANPLDGPPPPATPGAPPERGDFFSELSKQLSGKTEKKVNPLDALTKKKD